MFRDIGEALRFTFRVQASVICKTQKYERGSIATDRETLTQHDLHAQAAMIQARILRLSEDQQIAIFAYYGFGPSRIAAMRALSDSVRPELPTLRLGMLNDLVRRECDIGRAECETLEVIAKRRGLSVRQIINHQARVREVLRPHLKRSYASLHDELAESGLIHSD